MHLSRARPSNLYKIYIAHLFIFSHSTNMYWSIIVLGHCRDEERRLRSQREQKIKRAFSHLSTIQQQYHLTGLSPWTLVCAVPDKTGVQSLIHHSAAVPSYRTVSMDTSVCTMDTSVCRASSISLVVQMVSSLPAVQEGSVPGSGRSPAEGNGSPLKYSCLENPMDRGAWRAAVHGVAKSQTWLSD